MMCIKHGAEYVIACEMFEAMAEVAREVIQHNGMEDRILVVTAKSSDIEALPFSPDIVLSELLDSALLGEGVMFSHADAIDRFIDPTPNPGLDAAAPENDIRTRVIPYAATVSGVLVESSTVLHMTTVTSQCLGGFSPVRMGPSNDQSSCGERIKCPSGRMLPVHWNTQVQGRGAGSRVLSEPAPLLEVNFFSSLSSSPSGSLDAASRCRITVTQAGTVHGLLLWWKTDLLAPEVIAGGEADGPGGEFSYSTEPDASHGWQDHWQQVVFPLSGPEGEGQECALGDVFEVTTSHDGLHIWCHLEKVSSSTDESAGATKRPRLEENEPHTASSLVKVEPRVPDQCQCGWHVLCGSDRMQLLNDAPRIDQWRAGIGELVGEVLLASSASSTPLFLDVSDGSMLGFMAAAELVKRGHGKNSSVLGHILSLERKPYSALFHNQLVAANSSSLTDDALVVLDEEAWEECWLQGGGECPVWELEQDEEDGCSKMESAVSSKKPNRVAAVLCECFFYQLHSLPVQAALSYYYAVNGIKKNVRENNPGSRVYTCPLQARVMVAAFELADLHISHGQAGM